MKVSEYRDLIGALSNAYASLRSAATDEEQASEAAHVRRLATELMDADCPRASDRDRERAERWIDSTASYLIQSGLTASEAQSVQVQADSNEVVDVAELDAIVDATPNSFRVVAIVEDWGSGRGRQQGKRIGHMVVGAMSDAPRGKKTYFDAFGNIPGIDQGPEGEAIRLDVESLRGAGIVRYLKARSAGMGHEVSMRLAYEATGEAGKGLAAEYINSTPSGR